MSLDNSAIYARLSLLAKLIELHDNNPFRAKSYAGAVNLVRKLPQELSTLSAEERAALGIRGPVEALVGEMLETGTMQVLEDYLEKTPPGVLEMLSIKGLGPKKVGIIWKDLQIETPGELLHACEENRIARAKGFGTKTQEAILEALRFHLQNQGWRLYASVEAFVSDFHQTTQRTFPEERFDLTGAFRRQSPVLDRLEWVSTASPTLLEPWFRENGFETETTGSDLRCAAPGVLPLIIYSRPEDRFGSTLFETTGSPEFLKEWYAGYPAFPAGQTEQSYFEQLGLHFLEPARREAGVWSVKNAADEDGQLIRPEDIRGIIHSHSHWSDGSHPIEQMAEACLALGCEYLVISDHSQSAAYANGLQIDRLRKQHEEIDELNRKLAPFRIFKSIESDILYDGALDYPDEILARFDLVIASIHGNLRMPQEKAMQRLLRAIANPYTTILGHMTGRLLLSRPGYPVDHRAVIEACAQYRVAIEINANPRRLDMDWSWIPYAKEKGVMLSINPDAHHIREIPNTRYGVLAAQKGGLSPRSNLSSMSLTAFTQYLEQVRRFRGI